MTVRFVFFICVLCGISSPVVGQLISPGELTESHASLEGLTNCTTCHNLGQRGIAPTKCLSCHKPLSTRIEASIGFHATVVAENCGTCHKEHFGKSFDAIRFDTTSFDHQDAGFKLLASHRDVACSNCHTPENITDAGVIRFKSEGGSLDKTFLGLNPLCASCHTDSSPHVGQFVQRDCAACHDEDTWEEAPLFDHAKAAFPLLGRHVDIACSSCHDSATSSAGEPFTVFSPVPFAECSTCHADPHTPTLGSNCSTCHSEKGFGIIKKIAFEKTFNHDRTSFKLIGEHASIQCASCHSKNRRSETIAISFSPQTSRKTYPSPIVDDCESCHVDYHDDTFTELDGGSTCSNCHTEYGWTPPTFDLERHNTQTDFLLIGAHQATPCVLCHSAANFTHTENPFKFETKDCETCHLADNAHGPELTETTSCSTCHTEEAWETLSDFDHSSTEFPLFGRHSEIQCTNCHIKESEKTNSLIIFNTITDNCIDCHTADNPHKDQFEGVSCKSCHTDLTFKISDFDHSGTSFPLSPAHQGVTCQSCHLKEESPTGLFTRFKPVSTRCEDCH